MNSGLQRNKIGRMVGRVWAVSVMAAVLISAGFSMAWAGPSNKVHQRIDAKPMTPKRKKAARRRIMKMEETLKHMESDHDKYVVLRRMLKQYAILDEMDTPRAQALKGHWDAVLHRNPEFRKNRPRETKGQRELREKTKSRAQSIDAASKLFVPKDTRAKVFWSGNHLAAAYQFRVEFYDLPENIEPHIEYGGKWQKLRGQGRWQGATFELRFMRGENRVKLKPVTVISFAKKTNVEGSCSYSSSDCGYIALNTDVIYPEYSPSDQEEWEKLRGLRRAKKTFDWKNPNASFEEFYGVISIDGSVLGQIPFAKASASNAVKVVGIAPNGTAHFGVGSAIPSEDDPDFMRFGSVKEVITWSKEDGIHRESTSAAIKKYPYLGKSPWLK